MSTYVAFLRGVNVGGVIIPMADLRAMFTGLGFTGVATVLATGNVVFDAGADTESEPGTLKTDIEAALRETFGYDAWIVLVPRDAVARILDAYPFDPEPDGRQPYVVLSSDATVLGELAAVADPLDPVVEQITPGDNVLYWEVERGRTTTSAFGKRLASKRYRAATTTRNLRTLRKLR